jgi:hypothetical protein
MKLTPKQIERYRAEPAAFIEEQLYDPITNKPFVLLPAERAFIVALGSILALLAMMQ